MGTSFWNIDLGHVIGISTLLVAVIAYKLDRGKDSRDRREAREKMIKEQTTMHMENKGKFDQLAEFHRNQLSVNDRRDAQIGELKTQTATLLQVAQGLDRRLEMMENRRT